MSLLVLAFRALTTAGRSRSTAREPVGSEVHDRATVTGTPRLCTKLSPALHLALTGCHQTRMRRWTQTQRSDEKASVSL